MLAKVLDTQTEVLPAGQKFSSVSEKSKNMTKGRVIVGGNEYEGYMVEDGRVIINKPYE